MLGVTKNLKDTTESFELKSREAARNRGGRLQAPSTATPEQLFFMDTEALAPFDHVEEPVAPLHDWHKLLLSTHVSAFGGTAPMKILSPSEADWDEELP